MTSPLNPDLFRALQRKFRHVAIANEGEPYIPARTRSTYRRGKMDSPPAYAGEYYRVCCPFCGDTRQRLWINHMFNVMGADGDDHLYLAWCFNEECIDSRETQKKLLDWVFPFGYRARQRVEQFVPPQSPMPESPEIDVRLPVCLPLSDPIASMAANYLWSRGFDPVELVDRWGIAYCPISPHSSPRIINRIIIPVHTLRIHLDTLWNQAVLGGWQAREISDSPGQSPKYLSMQGMKKSRLLYGLPQASLTEGPVILVEGVTDVWRLGSHAVAIFGKSLSAQQRSLLTAHFHRRPIIVMFDLDAQREAILAANAIREARREWNDPAPVVIGQLPPGAGDIGEATRESAWEAIHFAVASSGAA